MDLIAIENQTAAGSAVAHLGGAVRRKTENLRSRILEETAFIEAALDDPEHYDLDGYGKKLKPVLQQIMTDIQKLLDTADEGRIMKEGIATVILGRPNVGKSTLLNLLSGEERAIVTDIAGTTRDILEEKVILGGVPLRIVDTAGLRDTEDTVERIGVERARACAKEAELIFYILDGTDPLTEEDRRNLAELQGRKVILLVNKTDLPEAADKEDIKRQITAAYDSVLCISALKGEGIAQLSDKIREMFLLGKIKNSQEVYITNTRHKVCLTDAKKALMLTMESIDSGMPEDVYTIDLMDAYSALGRITGEEVGEDLINEIFSRFCMGK